MGDIVGGIIGGIGSLTGGSKAQKADMTGFNYLTSGGGASTIKGAQTAGQIAQQGATATQGSEAQLLGQAPITSATSNGFNNYLNSTGYNFQMDQGQRAITGSAAAKGILNSGSTAKALTQYGQGLAGGAFNNYLGQLNNLNTQQSNTAAQGINATVSAGSAGTSGGVAAGNNVQSGISSGAAQIGGAVGSGIAGFTNMNNFFGGS